MNNTASGAGVSAIRSLRSPQPKGSSHEAASHVSPLPATWSKQELGSYVKQCGLTGHVSVLASLQADGRMLPLLCDESMVKYAVADPYQRSSFVMCMRACLFDHELAILWNVTTTIEWLSQLQLESFTKQTQAVCVKHLVHGAYLCHLVNTGATTTVLQLSPSDASQLATFLSNNEELQRLAQSVKVKDETTEGSGGEKGREENQERTGDKGEWHGPKTDSSFSEESVQMPGSSPQKKEKELPVPVLQHSVIMLSTPRYTDEQSDQQEDHQQDQHEDHQEYSYGIMATTDSISTKSPTSTTATTATTTTTTTTTTSAPLQQAQKDGGEGGGLLLPLAQYIDDEEDANKTRNDGFFSKVLWDRSHVLGRGAFGAVYKGFDAGSGCFVAIKEFLTTDLEELNHQVEEIKLLKALVHPNVVSYLGATMREKTNDWGATEPVLCIATELMAGGSIGGIVSNYGPLEEGVVQTYTKDILSGLAYLHEQKLVHRDIKPENILISVDGRCKIGDFGESKFLQASMTAKNENLTMKGTPYFMAPEVLLEDGHGRKADIWSVGSTVLSMATGCPPWREEGFKQIVQLLMYLGRNPDAVPSIPKTCSPQLTSFLQLCLQRQPALRLSASDLLKHEFIVDESIASYVNKRRNSFNTSASEGQDVLQRTVSSGGATIRRIVTQGEQMFS